MNEYKFEQSVEGIVKYVGQFVDHHNYSITDIHLKIISQEEEIDKYQGINFLFDNNNQLKEVMQQVTETIFTNNTAIKFGMLNYINLSEDNVARFFYKWPNYSQFS